MDNSVADRQQPKKEYLVGINYFSGWWRQMPNKYVIKERDWRVQYPERIPILGCYNDQETMDSEILAASKYGVDFFLMLWYVQKPERHPHSKRLNKGIEQFIASPESHRLCFAIEYCNHQPFEIKDNELWEDSCRQWIKIMQHPSYLRIGGKAVFKIHGLSQVFEENENSVTKVMYRIERLRKLADNAGVGPLLIGVGTVASGVQDENRNILKEIFDFFATYMDIPDLPNKKNEDYPYKYLIDFAEKGWKNYCNNSILPYMPYVPAGWNPRPWFDPRPSFKLPNKAEWRDALLRVKESLDRYPILRLPNGTKQGQKVFNIYAWNEFGEGGTMAPTLGEGWMKLETVREIFGR